MNPKIVIYKLNNWIYYRSKEEYTSFIYLFCMPLDDMFSLITESSNIIFGGCVLVDLKNGLK